MLTRINRAHTSKRTSILTLRIPGHIRHYGQAPNRLQFLHLVICLNSVSWLNKAHAHPQCWSTSLFPYRASTFRCVLPFLSHMCVHTLWRSERQHRFNALFFLHHLVARYRYDHPRCMQQLQSPFAIFIMPQVWLQPPYKPLKV